jgi:hypothetical protein
VDLEDCNFRVVVVGGPADDDFTGAIDAADNLLLVAGHGGGTIGPGENLPEADKWSVYALAESAEDAKRMVSKAVEGLERQRFIASVEPVDLRG